MVRELAVRTKAFAQMIGCEKVLGPKRGGPEVIKLRKLPNGDTTGDFIPAESGWSVMVLPGAGAEPAEFGLCRYPGSPHWNLAGACKIQYAAQNGWEHFLLCHRRLISLLDLWRDFGVDVKVTEESEFWETRSVEQLRERLNTYDRLVAAMAGALKDSLGKGPKEKQSRPDTLAFTPSDRERECGSVHPPFYPDCPNDPGPQNRNRTSFFSRYGPVNHTPIVIH
ncbi:MAG: hypothetical protein KIS67_17875 [Verrucomicrobiae bacterium]|nr:hypothetical protein [Verrucomicrobiae bacterium]